jgi:hypothetical protein
MPDLCPLYLEIDGKRTEVVLNDDVSPIVITGSGSPAKVIVQAKHGVTIFRQNQPGHYIESDGCTSGERVNVLGQSLVEQTWKRTLQPGKHWLYINSAGNQYQAGYQVEYRAEQSGPIRADTEADVRKAIDAGAKHIQTTGFDLSGKLDAKGALIELLDIAPSWKPIVNLVGGHLLNAVLQTPKSIYTTSGVRTKFWKAVTCNSTGTLEGVFFAPDCGFCIHNFGKLRVERTWATTFSEYWYFGQGEESFVHATGSGFIGGSKVESGFRVQGGRYYLEDCTLDNRQGGKAALRGDSPVLPSGSPGGVCVRCKFYGQVGPNPLTEDDGGQCVGVNRWRFAEGHLFFTSVLKETCIAYAKQLADEGKTLPEIVRATADKFIDPKDLGKVANGKRKLTDDDIRETLKFRAAEIGRTSYARFEDCEIIGNYRPNARSRVEFVRTPIKADVLFDGAQAQYPWPADRVLSADEVKGPPEVTFTDSPLTYTDRIAIDLKKWPTFKMDAASNAAKAHAQQAQT